LVSDVVPYLNTSRLRIHYRRLGQGPQPMVFVHGSFATSRWWEPAVKQMPQDVPLTSYLLDLRGCGDSQHSEELASYEIAAQAADLASFLATLNLRAVHLVGHSMGAAIALNHVAQDPTRVRSLTLVATPSPAGTPTPETGLELLRQMQSDRGLLVQALASTMPARPPDAFFQQLVEDAQAQAPASFTANAQALATWRLADESLAQVRLPVLLLWGDHDHFVLREVQRHLLLSMPGANNLEVFRGVGHSPMLERPEGFIRVLLDFVLQDFEGYADIRDVAAEG
jgi:branched-chain amino acid transport system permease protein